MFYLSTSRLSTLLLHEKNKIQNTAIKQMLCIYILALKKQADGGPWNPDLLFSVPRSHQEIARLEGRYKSVGGVKEGLVVELSNGGMAVVTECTDEVVQLDANSMLAGKKLVFEIELVGIERD